MPTSFVPCCPSCNFFFLFVWGYGRKRSPRRRQQVVDPSVGPLFRFRAVSRVGLDSGRYSSVIRSVSGGEGHKATECPALLGQLLRGPSGGHVMVLWETCAVVFLLVAQHCRGATDSELLANFRRCQRMCNRVLSNTSLLGVMVGIGENLQNATVTVGTGIRGGIQGVATGVRKGTAAIVDNVRKNIQGVRNGIQSQHPETKDTADEPDSMAINHDAYHPTMIAVK
ncbi:hypothetical protein ISCGN_026619 [Ixodes scapularis]